MSILGIRPKLRAADGEKRVAGGKSRSLVAVDERRVQSQALPKGNSLLNEISVVAGLWSIERRFHETAVTYPLRSAVTPI